MRAYASMLMPETAEQVRDAVHRYVEQGFTAIKFGYGPLGKDIRKDVALATAAKQAAGQEVEVMIDIGHGYSLKMAMQAAKEFEQLGIYWMEEPLPPEAIEDYQRLCDSTSLRVAAGEQGRRPLGFPAAYLGCSSGCHSTRHFAGRRSYRSEASCVYGARSQPRVRSPRLPYRSSGGCLFAFDCRDPQLRFFGVLKLLNRACVANCSWNLSKWFRAGSRFRHSRG